MAEWAASTKHNGGKPFSVIDKTSGAIVNFDPSGKPVGQVTALFGRRKGDKVLEEGISHRTPAGSFDIEQYDSEDYGPALRFAKYDSNNFLIHNTPTNSPTAPPAQRKAALKSDDPADNRQSSGCVNVDPSETPQMLEHFKEGGKLLVLPETEEGFDMFPGFAAIRERRAATAALDESQAAGPFGEGGAKFDEPEMAAAEEAPMADDVPAVASTDVPPLSEVEIGSPPAEDSLPIPMDAAQTAVATDGDDFLSAVEKGLAAAGNPESAPVAPDPNPESAPTRAPKEAPPVTAQAAAPNFDVFFRAAHGTSFDPTSRVDAAKMNVIREMIAEDPKLSELKPNKFALALYKRS